jgi:hypothetical protein
MGLALLAAGLYVGTWVGLALSTDRENVLYGDGTVYYERESPLRYQVPMVRAAFAPAEWIDRKIRPVFWRELARPSRPAT